MEKTTSPQDAQPAQTGAQDDGSLPVRTDVKAGPAGPFQPNHSEQVVDTTDIETK